MVNFFIGRPIFASVLALLMLLVGGICIFVLPISQIVEQVRAEMDRLSLTFPPDLEYRIAYDTTKYVEENITVVEHTLVEAFVLVLIVVLDARHEAGGIHPRGGPGLLHRGGAGPRRHDPGADPEGPGPGSAPWLKICAESTTSCAWTATTPSRASTSRTPARSS